MVLKNVQIPFIATFDYSGAQPVDTLNFHKAHSVEPIKNMAGISNRIHLQHKLPFADYRYRFSRKQELEIQSTIGSTQSAALDASGWWRICQFTTPSFEIINLLDKPLNVHLSCPWLHFPRSLPAGCRKIVYVIPDKLQHGLNRAMFSLSGNDFDHTLLIDLHGVSPEPAIKFATSISNIGNIDIGTNIVGKIEMVMEGAGVCDGVLFCPQIGLVRKIQMDNLELSKNCKSVLVDIDTSLLRSGQQELVFYFVSNTVRHDLRFLFHKFQFKSRYLMFDPEIIIYDMKKQRFIPEIFHVGCSDGLDVRAEASVHSDIRSKIEIVKIDDNTFRLVPLKDLCKLNSVKGIDIMNIHIKNSEGTLNRDLKVIINK